MASQNREVVVNIISDASKFLKGYEQAIEELEKYSKKADIASGMQQQIDALKNDVKEMSVALQHMSTGKIDTKQIDNLGIKLEKQIERIDYLYKTNKEIKIKVDETSGNKFDAILSNANTLLDQLNVKVTMLNNLGININTDSVKTTNERIHNLNLELASLKRTRDTLKNDNSFTFDNLNSENAIKELKKLQSEYVALDKQMESLDGTEFENATVKLGILSKQMLQLRTDFSIDSVKGFKLIDTEILKSNIQEAIDINTTKGKEIQESIKTLKNSLTEVINVQFQNGKLTVPLEVETNIDKLQKQATELIQQVQTAIWETPLMVPLKFTSSYITKAQDELKGLENTVNSLGNSDKKAALVSQLENLKKQLKERDFRVEFKSNITELETDINKGLKAIQKSLKDARLYLYPEVVIDEESKTKIQNTLNEISKALQLDLSQLGLNINKLLGDEDRKKIQESLKDIKIEITPSIKLTDKDIENINKKLTQQLAKLKVEIDTTELQKGLAKALDGTLIDKWGNKFISTIDTVCRKIDDYFGQLSQNQFYEAMKGWATADSIQRENRVGRVSNEGRINTIKESTAYGELERFALVNSKTNKIFGDYLVDQAHSVSASVQKALKDLASSLGKSASEVYDTIIHSHPVAKNIEYNGKKYQGVGNNLTFSSADLQSYQMELKNGFKKMMVESNGMIRELDLSTVDDRIVAEIVKEYSKKIKTLDMSQSWYSKNGKNISDYSLRAGLSKDLLSSIISSKGLDASQYLKDYSIESLKVTPENIKQNNEEVSQLIQLLNQMSTSLTEINKKNFKLDTKSIDSISKKLESLLAVLKELNTQVHNFDFSNINVSVEPIEKIVDALSNLSNMFQRAFNVASDTDINNQWGKLQEQFNSFAKDDGNFDSRKKEVTELIKEYQKYLDMGGKDPITNLTSNKKGQDKLTSQYNKYLVSQKRVAEESAKAIDTENKVLEQTESIAKKSAKAKEEFTQANQGVKKSAEQSAQSINEEVAGMKSVQDVSKHSTSTSTMQDISENVSSTSEAVDIDKIKLALTQLEEVTQHSLKSTINHWDKLDDEMKAKCISILNSIGLVNEKGEFLFGNKSGGNANAFISEDFVILQKAIDKDTVALNEFISKLQEAKKIGINVAQVYGYQYTTTSYNADNFTNSIPGYEIQERANGSELHQTQKGLKSLENSIAENQRLLSASKEHLVKFVQDWIALNNLGLQIDPSKSSNFFYDINKGFEFIDLGLKSVGNKAVDIETMFREIITSLVDTSSMFKYKDTNLTNISGELASRVAEIFKDLGLLSSEQLVSLTEQYYSDWTNVVKAKVGSQTTTTTKDVSKGEDASNGIIAIATAKQIKQAEDIKQQEYKETANALEVLQKAQVGTADIFKRTQDNFDFTDPNLQAKKFFEEYANSIAQAEGLAESKYTINTDANQNFKSATVEYYNEALKQTITETWQWHEANQKIEGDTDRMIVSNIKFVDNVKARYEQQKKDNEIMSKSLQKANEALTSFDSKTQGKLKDNAKYKELSNLLSNGFKNLDDVERAQKLMNELNVELNNINADARRGSASFDIFSNMVKGINEADNKVKLLTIDYQNLTNVPDDVTRKFEKLQQSLSALKNAQGVENQAKAYGDYREALNEATYAIKIFKKEQNLIDKTTVSYQKDTLLLESVNTQKLQLDRLQQSLKTNGLLTDELSVKFNNLYSELEKVDSVYSNNLWKKSFQQLKVEISTTTDIEKARRNTLNDIIKLTEKIASKEAKIRLLDTTTDLADIKQLQSEIEMLQTKLNDKQVLFGDLNGYDKLDTTAISELDTIWGKIETAEQKALDKKVFDTAKQDYNDLKKVLVDILSVKEKLAKATINGDSYSIEAYTNQLSELENKASNLQSSLFSNVKGLNVLNIDDLNKLATISDSFDSKLAPLKDKQLGDLKSLYNQLEKAGLLTDNLSEKFEKLAISLGSVENNDGLKDWVSQFNNLKSLLPDETVKYFKDINNQINKIMGNTNVDYTGYEKQFEKLIQLVNEYKVTLGLADKTDDMVWIDGQKDVATYQKEIQSLLSYLKQIPSLQKSGWVLDTNNISPVTNIDQVADRIKELAKEQNYGKQIGEQYSKSGQEVTLVFKNQDGIITKVRGKVDDLSKSMQTLTTQSDGAVGLFGNFSKTLSQAAKQLITYYFGVNDFIRYFKEGINIVREFDAAMTELIKVSNDAESELFAFEKEAFNIANTIGSTGKEIINSAADWEKLGYAIEDASELAKNSALYSNVGDVDIDTATEHMVSTLQAFNIEAQDSISIVDKFNEVGNNYAITSEGIGAALERSAASFNAANTDLDKSIALITVTNAVIQNSEKVGNMWATVSARIRGSKQELEDLGEETDEYVTSTSKLRDMIKGVTGFDIMEDENTYKDVYEIIVGIGEVWDELSDIDRAGLLEALAGKRQSNALAAALNNAEMLKDVYESSVNADGSALKENEKYLESIQGHLDKLTNKWQEVWTETFSRDAINFFVDLGTKILEVVDFIGLIPTAFAGVVGVLSAKTWLDTKGGGRAKKELSKVVLL